jgi:hypothetical protein
MMTTEEDIKQEIQEAHLGEKKRFHRIIYILLLFIFLALVFGFAFIRTESSIDIITREYPQRLELRDNADAENTAFAMQLLFRESSSILDDINFDVP